MPVFDYVVHIHP